MTAHFKQDNYEICTFLGGIPRPVLYAFVVADPPDSGYEGRRPGGPAYFPSSGAP